MIAPYRRPPAPRSVALAVEPGRVLTEDGELVAMDRWDPLGTTVYARREVGEAWARAGEGTLVMWNGKAIAWVPTCGRADQRGPAARRITLIRDLLPVGDQAAMAELHGFAGWVRDAGAAPRSLGSTSESILRATLAAPLWTSAGTPPPVRVMVGGRQESNVEPGSHYGPMKLWDLRAAYATTLARLRYGGAWYERPAGDRGLRGREDGPLFGHASVTLRGAGALVRRPRRSDGGNIRAWEAAFDSNGDLHAGQYPSEGRITGTWTRAELEAARDGGARVKLDRIWHHAAETHPFRRWWEVIERGRALKHGAALAKGAGNALWGRFAVTAGGSRQLVQFARGGQLAITPWPIPGGGRPAALDLAESVTGTVRAELHRLMVSAGDRLVSAHTDGAWVYGDDDWKPPHAGWRLKDQAEAMDYLGPQFLCFRRPGSPTPVYRMAGVPVERQPAVFEEVWRAAGQSGPRRPPLAHVWPVPGGMS